MRNELEDYICLSNNCVESLNAFAKSMIPYNSPCGYKDFETILESVFIRMEQKIIKKRKHSEKDSFPD